MRHALARKLKLDRRGESDEAYFLRVANARAPRQGVLTDPLRALGEEALDAIRKHALGLDAYALRRLQPTVKLQRPHVDDPVEAFSHARFARR